MVYKWNGYNLPVKAEIVGRELEKLERKNGSVQPEDMVKAAKSEKSVLHPLFEWDNDKAADAYRVEQAKTVIRLLVVEDLSGEGMPKKVRAFVNVSESREKGVFINTQKALETPETRGIVLRAAFAELVAFKAKYETYTELSRVFTAIEECADTF